MPDAITSPSPTKTFTDTLRMASLASDTDNFVGASFFAASRQTLQEMQTVATYVEKNSNAKAESDDVNVNLPELAPPVRASMAEKMAEGEADSSLLALLAQLKESIELDGGSLEKFKDRLREFNAAAAARNAVPEEYTEALANLEQARTNYEAAELNLANTNAGNKELALQALTKAVDSLIQATDTFLKTKSTLTPEVVKENILVFTENEKTTMHWHTEFLMRFQKVLEENNAVSLKGRVNVLREQQTQLQKDFTVSAEEYSKTQAKSAELGRIMGALGKVLGTLMTIVGLVTATTGIGLAIAGLGVAMLLADTACEIANVPTVSERIMKPIMNDVIMPMLTAISDFFEKKLLEAGVDPALSSFLGKTFAVLAVAAAVVAVVVVGKFVAGRECVKQLAQRFVDTISSTTVGSFLKSMGNKIGTILQQAVDLLHKLEQSIFKKFGIDSSKLPLYLTYANSGATALTGVGSLAEAGMGIASSGEQKDSTHSMSKVTIDRALLDSIKNYFSLLSDEFANNERLQTELVIEASNRLMAAQQTGSFIRRNISA